MNILVGQQNPRKNRNAANGFTIVDMIVKESVRLYPLVIALIVRTSKATLLGKLNFPQEMELMIAILAIHHD